MITSFDEMVELELDEKLLERAEKKTEEERLFARMIDAQIEDRKLNGR